MSNSWKNLFGLVSKRAESPKAPRVVRGMSGGQWVHEDSAMEVSAFYRGLVYVSTQIAKLPWYVKDADNRILNNDIQYLLNLLPNREMDAMMFRLYMIQTAIVHGNSYAEIERNNIGKPIALWPIDHKDVSLWRTSSGELVYRVLGTSSSNGGETYIPVKDIFHVRNFHTKDGYNGQGLLAYAKTILGSSLAANEMASGLFANGGLPSGVLEVEGVLSDEAYERIKASWKEQMSGKKSASTAILEEGLKYKAVSHDPETLQFLETRQFSVLEIARFLGVPPTKLYDNKASTYSNQENSSLEVVADTLDAWCRMLEIQADIKLLSRQSRGYRTEIDLFAVNRADMTTRANYYSKMMQMSAINPNEVRKNEGKAPYDGGDRFYVASNNFTPVDKIDDILDAQIEKNKGSGDGDQTSEAEATAREIVTNYLKS